MDNNKIVPCLWFFTEEGKISNVIDYYKKIFNENFHEKQIIPLGETPGGNTEMCEVFIFDQKYNLMSTAKEHHRFNDALAFAINCEDQFEIDRYWNYFIQEGEESQCGWCIDKYGLRWQVLPKNLDELMSKPNSFQILMNQKKIIINDFLR